MDSERISALFNACFDREGLAPVDRARMYPGALEPLYQPPQPDRPWGLIACTGAIAQSCLHEAAHWLYAGRRRRALEDYGYWYLPDGRDAAAQARFEQHEAPVQAIECTLAAAAGLRFHFSADNLERPTPSSAFVRSVGALLPQYLERPSQRLQAFQHALARSGSCSIAALASASREAYAQAAAAG